jgi:hypothetical protein
MNKYQPPKRRTRNVISFTCSDQAVEVVLKLLQALERLGSWGCSRNFVMVDCPWEDEPNQFFFDGDGSDKLGFIKVNGLSLAEWRDEWDRMAAIAQDREQASETTEAKQ